MRKIIAIFCFLALGFIAVGCKKTVTTQGTTTGSNTPTTADSMDLAAVEKALNDLTVSAEVTNNFTLATTGVGNVTISWTSDNAAIAINGQNATVTQANQDVTVKLTATATKNLATDSKEFTVVVKALEAIDTLTVAGVYASTPGTDAKLLVKGIVSGFVQGVYNNAPSPQGIYLTDATGTIYYYGYEIAGDVAVGDEIIIEANYVLSFPDATTGYTGSHQLSTGTLKQKISSGNAIPKEGVITGKTIKEVADTPINAQNNISPNTYIFAEASIDKYETATYVTYSIKDSSGGSLGLYGAGTRTKEYGYPEFAWLDEYVGKKADIMYTINGTNSGKTKWRGNVLDVSNVKEGGGDQEPQVKTIAETIALPDDTLVSVSGAVIEVISSGTNINGFVISDTTGTLYVFGNKKNPEVLKGQYVTVTAPKTTNFGNPQLKLNDKTDVVVDSSKGTENTYAPGLLEESTVAEIANTPNSTILNGKIIKLEGTYVHAQYPTITNGDNTLNVYSSDAYSGYAALNGKNCEIVVVVYNYHSQYGWRLILLSLTEKALTPDQIAVNAALDAVVNPFSANYSSAISDIALPASTDDTVTFAYTSTSSLVTIANGKVSIALPASGIETVEVVLTATKNDTTATKTFEFTVGTAVGAPVIINEVYGGGGNSGAKYKNDFIELYNTTDNDIDVSGWQIQYASKTGSFNPGESKYPDNVVFPANTIIKAKGYLLIQLAAGTGGTDNLPTPDIIGEIVMSGKEFKIALVNSSTKISSATDPSVVDFVGLGTANEFEGEVGPAIDNTTSASRTDFVDTDNNKNDFKKGDPTPTNSKGETA